jgi:hypothetical protein
MDNCHCDDWMVRSSWWVRWSGRRRRRFGRNSPRSAFPPRRPLWCLFLSLAATFHATSIAIDGCFDICMLSWTAITLRSVFYLPICTSYFLSKMAIIRIWARKLVFGATPITQYSCPHCDWWLFWHLHVKLNNNHASVSVLSANLRELFLVKDGNNSHLSA